MFQECSEVDHKVHYWRKVRREEGRRKGGRRREEEGEGRERDMYIDTYIHSHLTLIIVAAGITYLGAQRWNAVELYPQFPNTLPFTFHTV